MNAYAYAILSLMRDGSKASGYTFTEVMIFLAVSSFLLVSALILVGGQQAKTQFTQGVINLQSQIEDVINDNNSGFYLKDKDFYCVLSAGNPTIKSGASLGQGESADCIYLGRFLQFFRNTATSTDQIIIHTIVGRRLSSSGQIVTGYPQARLISIVNDGTDSVVDATETINLENGLRISTAAGRGVFITGAGGGNTNAVGFLANLSQYSYNSASLSTSVVSYPVADPSRLTFSTLATAANIKANLATNVTHVVDQPVEICVNSATNQSAMITAGINNGLLSTRLQYFNNPDCA